MKILHISDFHYKDISRLSAKQEIIVSNIIEKCKEHKIDIVIFTGDLVHSGNNIDNFDIAAKILFDKLISELELSKSSIFICQGNHDINRNKKLISPSVLHTYFGLKSDKEIEDEMKNNISDYEISIKPSENYLNFTKKYFADSDIRNHFYSIHQRTINEISVGIVSINSSWLAQNDDCRGKLLYPINKIYEASKIIKNCNYKIVLMHHPFYYFKEFNKKSIEDIIYSKYDFVFFGDTHNRESFIRYSTNGGNIILYSKASLIYDKDNTGFSIIEFDNATEEITIESFNQDSENNVYALEPIHFDYPRNETRMLQNKLRKFLRNHYDYELSQCDGQFNIPRTEEVGIFFKTFTEPSLKTKSELELSISQDNLNNITTEKLKDLSNNYVLIGKEKSGKTSILKKIQLDLLSQYDYKSVIPLYISLYHKSKFKNININDEFDKLFSSFNKKEKEIIKQNNKFLILIDDYDLMDLDTLNVINLFMTKNPNYRIVISLSDSIHNIKNLTSFSFPLEKIYIHNITRKQIRELAKKTLNLPENELEILIERIINTFMQFSIPLCYWTVSMFLWIAQRNKHYTTLDNSEFIENYVDQLIDKEHLSTSRNHTFSYNDYKELLANIAFWLYDKYEDSDYSAHFSDVIKFIEDYINANIRSVGNASEILEYTFQKFILKKDSEDKVSFSVKADFEYFLAFYMFLQKEFRDKVVKDETLLFSFKNELELYSGIIKNDREFLNNLYEITKAKLEILNGICPDIKSIDARLIAGIEKKHEKSADHLIKDEDMDADKLPDNIRDIAVTKSNNDDMNEEIDNGVFSNRETKIKKKEKYDINKKDYITFEKLLLILSRVFRNMGNIKDNKLNIEIFDYILHTYIQLGFFLEQEINHNIESIEEDIKKIKASIGSNKIELHKIEKILAIDKFIYEFIPLVTQVNLYYGIGHINIIKLINEKIKELLKEDDLNEYLLFLLIFLKVDLDVYRNHNEILSLIKNIKIKKLLFSSISKITYYYIFKSINDKKLEISLEKYYKDMKEELQTKKDRKEIGTGLQEIKNKVLFNRNNS